MAATVKYLSDQANKALAAPEAKDRLLNQGVEVAGTTPAGPAELIRQDAAQWAKLVRDAGIELE